MVSVSVATHTPVVVFVSFLIMAAAEGELAQQILGRLTALESDNQSLRNQLAQSQADQAAAAALPMTPPTQPVQNPMTTNTSIDLKLLGKPPTGIKSEAQWSTWYSMTTAYLQAVNPDYTPLLRAAEVSEETSWNRDLDAPAVQLSNQLYFILRMLVTEGRAAEKPLTIPLGEGFVLWSRIVKEYEPNYASRTMGLYNRLMQFQLDHHDVVGSLENSITFAYNMPRQLTNRLETN